MEEPSRLCRVERFSLQVLPDGRGFVIELVDNNNATSRIEFPPWALHQLMRVMPHVDAALREGDGAPIDAADLLAYPVIEWTIGRSGPTDGVALRLRNDRRIDAGFYFAREDAVAFHHELGEAINRLRAGSRRVSGGTESS